ncbi:hypothetical protein UT300007_17250 [Clostridium sp. CTA-7]
MGNLDYLKILGTCIATISAIVAFFISYFNNEQKKYYKLSDEYFEKVLVEYINKYNENKTINTVKYIKRNYQKKDYFIPSYVFYLVENDEKELLHKILVVDYSNKFPNDSNIVKKTIDSVYKHMTLVIIFTYILCTLASLIFGIMYLKILLETIYAYYNEGYHMLNKNNIISSIFMIILSMGLSVVSIKMSKFMINSIQDEYTMEKKKIEKIIERKNDIYIKKASKFYID